MGPSKITWSGTDGTIRAALVPFGINPTTDQVTKIRDYIRLILKWNTLTSLTSITDPIEIVERHFGESMYLCSFLPVENGRLADVGSGAGFPGLALKIACPELSVVLIESNKKKAAFLNEVVRTLELTRVEVLATRFEEMHPEGDPFNLITARAVGNFPELLRWSRWSVAERGHIALWAGHDDTIKISASAGWTWIPAVRIPESQRRYIIVGRPIF